MYDTRGATKQIIFRKTVCSKESDKIYEENLEIITIMKEVEKEILGIRVKEKQTSPAKKAMNLLRD